MYIFIFTIFVLYVKVIGG